MPFAFAKAAVGGGSTVSHYEHRQRRGEAICRFFSKTQIFTSASPAFCGTKQTIEFSAKDYSAQWFYRLLRPPKAFGVLATTVFVFVWRRHGRLLHPCRLRRRVFTRTENFKSVKIR